MGVRKKVRLNGCRVKGVPRSTPKHLMLIELGGLKTPSECQFFKHCPLRM
jgi:hypothetical protein